MNHDLRHCRAITLVMKAEAIDCIVRRNGHVPIPSERAAYAAVVAEIERRGQYNVLPYYKHRLETIYQPPREQR